MQPGAKDAQSASGAQHPPAVKHSSQFLEQ
jgi:hypothetical protein